MRRAFVLESGFVALQGILIGVVLSAVMSVIRAANDVTIRWLHPDEDGHLVGAAQEERFTRKKHDAAFPSNAVAYCLKEAGLTTAQLSTRVRCAECAGPLHSVKPWRVDDVIGKPLGRRA